MASALRFCTCTLILFAGALCLTSCKQKEADQVAETPQVSAVLKTNPDEVKVDKPELFGLVTVAAREVADKLQVTGSVSPDVSRELPVLSLANGRVVALHVQLGQSVRKGQLVMDVQSPDVATAFATYLKAVSDEHLAKVTLDRDTLLFDKGAIARSQVDAAENGEADAVAALNAAEQQLRILGVDKNNPGDMVRIYAPTSGVVVSQTVTNAGAAGINYAGNSGSLIIADLSHVWVIVDVYESDLASVKLGQHVEIHLNAFPGRIFDGVVGDIGATLDASLRTAKVRIQVKNPQGELRIGMFANATILRAKHGNEAAIPQNAVLHLHDTTYVYVPSGSHGGFRRIVVKTGDVLPGNLVVISTGLTPGQQVVGNALDLQNTADNQ